MKVLVVHNAYGRRSGEEVVVDNQCALLERKGHETRRFERSSAGLRGNIAQQARAFFAAFGSRTTLEEFSRCLNDFTPDIVHVHNVYPWISPAILPLCSQAGIPVVMTVHNYRLLCPNGRMFTHGRVCDHCIKRGEHWCVIRNCEDSLIKSLGYALRNYMARGKRWFLDHVTCFAVLTPFQKRLLLSAGYPGERIAVLPNAVSVPEMQVDCGLGESVGYVGRVSAEKGVSVLLDAMMGISCQCRVYGNYEAQPDLPKKAPPNVEFVGEIQHERIAVAYNKSRICVVPSIWYEGFPMTVLEAMAFARPVIASRIGGIADIVEEGKTGLLFEPGNSRELREKIRYLWNHPEMCQAIGGAARQKVVESFSDEHYYKLLMGIYEAVLSSGMARHTA